LNGVKKIFKRHIGKGTVCFAVGAAVQTFQVTTPRTFPK